MHEQGQEGEKGAVLGSEIGCTLAEPAVHNQLLFQEILLTASWLAYILTMDVTRHFAGMVHDKRLQM